MDWRCAPEAGQRPRLRVSAEPRRLFHRRRWAQHQKPAERPTPPRAWPGRRPVSSREQDDVVVEVCGEAVLFDRLVHHSELNSMVPEM